MDSSSVKFLHFELIDWNRKRLAPFLFATSYIIHWTRLVNELFCFDAFDYDEFDYGPVIHCWNAVDDEHTSLYYSYCLVLEWLVIRDDILTVSELVNVCVMRMYGIMYVLIIF